MRFVIPAFASVSLMQPPWKRIAIVTCGREWSSRTNTFGPFRVEKSLTGKGWTFWASASAWFLAAFSLSESFGTGVAGGFGIGLRPGDCAKPGAQEIAVRAKLAESKVRAGAARASYS